MPQGENMGASAEPTGLAGAEAPEPHSRLGPSGGIPSAKGEGFHSSVDDEETAAFIEGWNACLNGLHDFDLALHFWNRRRCGI